MREGSHLKPYEPNSFFPEDQSARPLVEGVVPRGSLAPKREHVHDHRPQEGGPAAPGEGIPVPVTLPLLKRGQQRFVIYCSPCHGEDGYGDGMVVQRGFSKPPSYHIDRLRQVPDSHLYEVITNGLGRMAPYAPQVAAPDRWAIVAYIRALQVSQDATLRDVPAEVRPQLEGDK
jgi:mono/diheme cytochrome c family protein